MTTPQNPAPAPAPAPPPVGVSAIVPDSKTSFLAAFKPEPSKAPPLEWVALGIGLVLSLTSLLPWVSVGSLSSNGLEITDGWIVLGSGIASIVMGFVGLSRDSWALALGQVLTGLVCLLTAVLNLNPGDDIQPSIGIYAAIVVSVILIGLSAYNAFDAFRKGAKY